MENKGEGAKLGKMRHTGSEVGLAWPLFDNFYQSPLITGTLLVAVFVDVAMGVMTPKQRLYFQTFPRNAMTLKRESK